MKFVIGIIGLSILVFFHELGHFLVAKAVGIEVEAFSIGMGPVLLHKKIKGTDYRISLIPIGGYCAMKGEKEFQEAIANNKKEISSDPTSFYGVHPFKRLLIAFAGPFANFLLGVIFYAIIAMIGYTYYTTSTTVKMADEVYPELTSVAHQAGLCSGDKIIAINDKPMNDFSDLAIFISTHGDEDLRITVLRDNQQMEFNVHSQLDKKTGSGKIGIVNDPSTLIEKEYPKRSFFPAIAEGVRRSNQLIALTFRSIKVLFKGIDLSNAVSGPARISEMLGDTVQTGFKESAKIGFISTFELLAIISISLFVTNLLPVPILDGGIILFALIECIIRKKLNPKFLQYIQYVGLAFIALLFAIAITCDVRYFFIKK